MGENERWALPNGLLPNEAASVIRGLDLERWKLAEERTAELIGCIQPNPPSEQLRNAVADYVQRLIMKCFPCHVFTFGSVPLKTYLPDGDIDLSAFSENQTLKDSWAHQVRDMLENEEKNENAEFRVKEVQYIQAEVKIIKCLVENIVVDISFNQVGGLCTLCFLEQVDNLIDQNHLFKRSIILIKAWCYYESRILGAHHGLISTYALETLVLYIFNVFDNSFAGPLEVLYRFLEFFSKFDWDNFCVSLWGPVPISSLPDVSAQPPRKDGEQALNKILLQAYSTAYAVHPFGQENQGQPFVSKHFNVIDPLRENNNLGRSVSKGNFFRIRSAFAFGAKRLTRLLDCPKEDLYHEVNQFFLNTWERHGHGLRPDAPTTDLWRLRWSDASNGPDNPRNISVSKRNDISSSDETQVDRTHVNNSFPSLNANHSLESTSKAADVSSVSLSQNQKSYVNPNARNSEPVGQDTGSSQNAHNDKSQRGSRPDNFVSGIQGRYLFARTRSSPELTEMSGDVSSQGRRNRAPESGQGQIASTRMDNSRRKNLEADSVASLNARTSTEEVSSIRIPPPQQSLDIGADRKSYQDDSRAAREEFPSVGGAHGMHQEEQDLVNLMASSAARNFNEQVHLPLNLASGHLPLPIPPSMLASMGYSQRNLSGMVPTNIPLIETPWGPNMPFPQGLVSSPLSNYFPSIGLASNHEDSAEPSHSNFSSLEVHQAEPDNDFWHEQDRGATTGYDLDNGSFDVRHSDDKQQSTSAGYNYGRSRASSSGSSTRVQQKSLKENRGSASEDNRDPLQHQDNRGSASYLDYINASSRSVAASHSSSMRSKTSSESSWEGSSAKTSKAGREKRGRRSGSSTAASASYGKGKSASEHSSTQADEDTRDWSPLSTVGTEIIERLAGAQPVTSLHVPSHQIPAFEPTQTSGSDSLIPLGPVLMGSGSRQRPADNSGALPFAFYPTGPPVPFVTMLPFYNYPQDSGNSDTSISHFSGEEGLNNNESDQIFDTSDPPDLSEMLSTPNSLRTIPVEPSEHKSDILNGDFASHWQNLQYGRLCQNSRQPSPLIYPSPLVVPPVYLQGRFPWDGPGRPVSTNMNLFTQLMGYGPRLVPVAPPQSVSNRPTNVYQRYVDEMPRYRSGTGTYLPNPKSSARDRHANSRRGNYSYDRSDHHGDRDGNWNSKPRTGGRNRSQAEKPNSRMDRSAASESRADRSWGSQRHETYSTYQSQNGPFRANSSQNLPTNVTYGMYPVPGMTAGGVSANGPTVPSLVMLYPYDQNAGYSSAEQLEFGTVGPVGFPSVNETSQLSDGSRASLAFEEQRFRGGTLHRSSPDQPSSPHLPRGL